MNADNQKYGTVYLTQLGTAFIAKKFIGAHQRASAFICG